MDQEPSPVGLPEQLLPGALLHGALRPGALLPAARWVCRPIGSSARDAGLACRGAREFTGQTLRGWGLPVLAEDAAVIVSELVTNALLQRLREGRGGGPGRAAHVAPGRARWCARSPTPARRPRSWRRRPPLAEAGRGLQVVQALSVTWGWTRLGGRRKVVWAALRLPRE